MKDLIKKLLPTKFLKAARPYYHGLLAIFGQWRWGWPSEKLVVIGVTGTSGKSTTINLLAQILNKNGYKTGFSTSANYSLGEEIFVNNTQLSMPSGWTLAKLLNQMVSKGCKYAIVEATSEGLAQNRHAGMRFDIALATNLAPAHIDSHGNFEKYRSAKAKLFFALAQHGKKSFFNKKIIGANLDNEAALYFLEFPADKKFGISFDSTKRPPANVNLYAPAWLKLSSGINFELGDANFQLPLMGEFNAYNALLAIACACELGIKVEDSARALADFKQMPGRMEQIPNTRGINIFVDFAPEPHGMQSALSSLLTEPGQKIIHIFGSTGGTRDAGKRFEFGKISAKFANSIIVTNDDVYDSNPNVIAQNVVEGINSVPPEEKKAVDVIIMLDRRTAIAQGLRQARPGDTLIITGKGTEQFLILPGNKKIAWDDKTVVLEELAKI